MQINPIAKHYYQKLWNKRFNDNNTEGKSAKVTEKCVDLIVREELETTTKALKAKKAPGSDGINESHEHAAKSFFT